MASKYELFCLKMAEMKILKYEVILSITDVPRNERQIVNLPQKNRFLDFLSNGPFKFEPLLLKNVFVECFWILLVFSGMGLALGFL